MQLYVYGQTDLMNNNVNKIALSEIEELIKPLFQNLTRNI